MQRFYLSLWLVLVIMGKAYSQNGEFIDNFDDNVLADHWVTTGTTFALSESNGELKVHYNRTGSQSTAWDQFHLNGVSVNVDAYPFISMDIRSDVAFQLAVKPVSGNGDDWLTVNIPGDNTYHNYVLEVNKVKGKPVVNVYIYFDGGSSTAKSGNVSIDNFILGYHFNPPAVATYLEDAIDAAGKLKAFIVEGTGEGEYPSGSVTTIQSEITKATATLGNVSNLTQAEVDLATDNLYDVLTNVESSVIFSNKGLIDADATKETVYLYKNLKHLSSQNKYLFGMHDATAYGINSGGSGWWDDGSASKSDIKQVTGSHPAVFSQDVYDIVQLKPSELTGYRHRQEVAYNAGGVITLVWHMSDPVNKTFYWDQLSPSYNVVESILPGGAHHDWYKNELKKLASYSKSLRGVNGEAIPIIFRPFHEHNGTWFWWGRTRCTTTQYNQLWQFTVKQLRDVLNVHNFIYAFSPDGNQYSTKSEYLAIYPGDSYTDIFGIDYYFGEGTTAARDRLRDKLVHIVEYADEKNKVAALTEFGDRLGWDDIDKIEITNFYTAMVLAAIKANPKANRIAYLATWRNANPNHHFAPYPGHKEVNDFIRFYDDPGTIFLNDVPELYYSLLGTQVPTSIDKGESSIRMYPNPAREKLLIRSDERISEIQLINTSGQVIQRKAGNYDNQHELDMMTLSKGLYTIRILFSGSDQNKTLVRRIVKE